MLNRNSKRFLSFLRRNEPDYEDCVYTYDFIEDNYPVPLEQVYATVRYLEKYGYLITATRGPSKQRFGVILTEPSLHPYEFAFLQLRSFLFKSIFTPIAVSIITTLITLYITRLLK